MIDYIPSLTQASTIEHYSCFLSHSTKDIKFINALYRNLQDKGIQCWYAPEDLKIGDKFRETIHLNITGSDKLLLVLSEESIQSDWVQEEVTKALANESNGKLILFPIMIDDAVMQTDIPWAFNLRENRHIGDFRCKPGTKKYEK